jgi:hypothetical protein
VSWVARRAFPLGTWRDGLTDCEPEPPNDDRYDGVEIMGSEGYLINQFLVRHANKCVPSASSTHTLKHMGPIHRLGSILT